jgi:PAS domain S-box-containing protein
MVTDLADKYGLVGVFLYSGNAVRLALEDAIEAARLRRIESTRRDYVNAILAHLNEGVAAVDAEGRVQAFNPAMERFLGTPAGVAVGRKLATLAPGLSLDGVMQSGTRELEAIHRLGDKMVVVNRIPIVGEAGTSGAVLTIQDANAIHRADRNLRSRTRARGRRALQPGRPGGRSAAMRDLRGWRGATRWSIRPCWSAAKAAPARKCWRRACTTPARAARFRSSPSTARRFRRRCSNRSCLATRRARSRARGAAARPACSNRRTTARCSWTRWATCRRRCKRGRCACCRKSRCCRSAASKPCRSTCA